GAAGDVSPRSDALHGSLVGVRTSRVLRSLTRSLQHCRGESFYVPLRARAHMTDNLGGHHATQPSACPKVVALRIPVEEARGIGIAGACGIDHRHPFDRIDDVHLVAVDDDGALLATGKRRDLAVLSHVLKRIVEVLDLIERQDLAFVGKQYVHVVLDELEELLAESRDTERVRECERDLDAGFLRLERGLAHGVLGTWLVPEVALEVEDL